MYKWCQAFQVLQMFAAIVRYVGDIVLLPQKMGHEIRTERVGLGKNKTITTDTQKLAQGIPSTRRKPYALQ